MGPGTRKAQRAGWLRIAFVPPRQQELLFHFLQLMEAVEHYQQKFRSQASVIDEIVDTTFEVNQAGPEGRAWGRAGTGRPGKGPVTRSGHGYRHMGIREGRGRWLSHPPIPPRRLERRTSGGDTRTGTQDTDFRLWQATPSWWVRICWNDCQACRAETQQSFKTPGGPVSSLAGLRHGAGERVCVRMRVCLCA